MTSAVSLPLPWQVNEVAVVFPDLDVATSGINEVDALFSAQELLRCVLSGLMDYGEPFPAPSALKDIPVDQNEKAILVTTEVGAGYAQYTY